MGKATIVGGGTDGLYTVALDYGTAERDARVARITTRLAELTVLIAAAQAALDAQQAVEDAQAAAVDAAIADYVATQAAVDAALDAVTAAQEAVNNLNEASTPEEVAAATDALTAANAAYAVAQAGPGEAMEAYTAEAAALVLEKQKTATLELPLDLLENEQAQLTKDKAYWQALVLSETRDAWCADLTQDASGAVGTVEIPGEPKLVLIVPGYIEPPAYNPAAHGNVLAREVQTPAQVFFNAAILPGWQKYKPTYRRGTITAVDVAADTADVALDNDTSSAIGLTINQTATLAAVPVQYMGCNAGVFAVGDKCVVKFTGQDWAKPKVVGFVDHPKECYSYEFFTSEHVVWSSMASPGYAGDPGTVADNFIAGSLVSVKGKTPKSIYSGALTPGAGDSWVVRPVTSPISKTDPGGNWASWQNQKCFEFSWWSGTEVVTSTQAQAPGLLSTCNWQSAHTSCQVGNRDHLMTDTGLDVPAALYTTGGAQVGAPTFAQAWVWWRRAVVVKANNGRRFFVMADNYGRFHVYPCKDYAPSYAPATYKTYTPPYPAWVTVPGVDSQKIAHQWNWQFSKDGTRCVCLPYHSEAGEFYKYGSSYVGTILPEEVAELLHPELAHLCREDTPGLVEFGIAITAGDSENDYSATFTLLRNDYFNTSGRYIFDAGYAMQDSWATEDALVTAEIECFTPPGGYAASSTDGTCSFTDTFESLRADMVFYANDAGLARAELRRIPVVEGRWGRFLTIDGYRLSLTPGNSGYLPGGTGVSLPLAAGGSRVFNSLWPSSIPTHSPVGSKLGFLYASDVRNGSLVYEIDDYVDGTAQVVGRAFNQEFYNLTDALGFTEANPRGAATVKVPVAGRRVYLYALATSISTAWGVGFNVHPKGHWSCQVAGAAMGNLVGLREAFDIVQPKGGQRITHKALFNAAFRQTRDYSFYTEAFTGKQLVDPGSFRTFGIWR